MATQTSLVGPQGSQEAGGQGCEVAEITTNPTLSAVAFLGSGSSGTTSQLECCSAAFHPHCLAWVFLEHPRALVLCAGAGTSLRLALGAWAVPAQKDHRGCESFQALQVTADPDSGSFITVWGPLPIARVASPAQGVCSQPEVPGRACEAQSLLWGPRVRGASAGGCVHACGRNGVHSVDSGGLPSQRLHHSVQGLCPPLPCRSSLTVQTNGLARRGELRATGSGRASECDQGGGWALPGGAGLVWGQEVPCGL